MMPTDAKIGLNWRRLTAPAALVLFVGALAAGTTVALAQQGGGDAPHWGAWRHGHGDHDHDGLRFCKDGAAKTAGLLAFAKVKLGITASEESAWNQFEEQVRAADAPILDLCAHLKNAPEPTALPDVLARNEAMAEAGVKALRILRPAVATMYGDLTPAQKQIADHLGPHGGPGGPWHHDMHGMGSPPGGDEGPGPGPGPGGPDEP